MSLFKLNSVRAISEKIARGGGGRGGGTTALFCTPPPIEFDFHRGQSPIDLQTIFNLIKAWPPTKLNLKWTFLMVGFLDIFTSSKNIWFPTLELILVGHLLGTKKTCLKESV